MRTHANPCAAALLAAVLCPLPASAWPPAFAAQPAAPSTAAPTLDQVKSATIAGVFDQPVTLQDGVYEGPPFVEGGASRPRLTLVDTLFVTGNLDETPAHEAVVLVAETSGASGERVYVAVVGARAGRAHSLATALVGDRTRIRSLTLVERAIVMDVIEAGPEDAMCCPTQLARKSFTLEQGALEMVSSEPTGTVSIAALADTEWTLVRMDDEPWPEDVPPATLALDGTRVAGFAGCNRFSGAVEETSPGRITMGPLVSTRMACPAPRMDLEHHFLDALGKATQYGFLMGRLALTAVDGTTIRRLEFAPGR